MVPFPHNMRSLCKLLSSRRPSGELCRSPTSIFLTAVRAVLAQESERSPLHRIVAWRGVSGQMVARCCARHRVRLSDRRLQCGCGRSFRRRHSVAFTRERAYRRHFRRHCSRRFRPTPQRWLGAASLTRRRTCWQRETPRLRARRQRRLATISRQMHPRAASGRQKRAWMAFVAAVRCAPARLAASTCVPQRRSRRPADPSARTPPPRLPSRRSRRRQQKGALSAGSSELEREEPSAKQKTLTLQCGSCTELLPAAVLTGGTSSVDLMTLRSFHRVVQFHYWPWPKPWLSRFSTCETKLMA